MSFNDGAHRFQGYCIGSGYIDDDGDGDPVVLEILDNIASGAEVLHSAGNRQPFAF